MWRPEGAKHQASVWTLYFWMLPYISSCARCGWVSVSVSRWLCLYRSHLCRTESDLLGKLDLFKPLKTPKQNTCFLSNYIIIFLWLELSFLCCKCERDVPDWTEIVGSILRSCCLSVGKEKDVRVDVIVPTVAKWVKLAIYLDLFLELHVSLAAWCKYISLFVSQQVPELPKPSGLASS